MVGSQVLVAFWENTTSLLVKTYDLTTTLLVGSPVLLPGKVSLNYTNYSAEATGTTVTIFATLQLQPNQSDSLIHVWNRGPSVNLTTYQPSPHIRSGQNLQSVANLDMSSGAIGALTGIHLRLKEVSYPWIIVVFRDGYMGHARDCNSMYGISWPRVLALNISLYIFLVSWIWTSYSQPSLIYFFVFYRIMELLVQYHGEYCSQLELWLPVTYGHSSLQTHYGFTCM